MNFQVELEAVVLVRLKFFDFSVIQLIMRRPLYPLQLGLIFAVNFSP
jgi:hypothetical protein